MIKSSLFTPMLNVKFPILLIFQIIISCIPSIVSRAAVWSRSSFYAVSVLSTIISASGKAVFASTALALSLIHIFKVRCNLVIHIGRYPWWNFCIICFDEWVCSVSYTHLDVYKRQCWQLWGYNAPDKIRSSEGAWAWTQGNSCSKQNRPSRCRCV